MAALVTETPFRLATDPSSDTARSLLFALVDELSRPAEDHDTRMRRHHEAALALQRFTAPAALFGGAAGAEPLSNTSWGNALGTVTDLPEVVTSAIELAHGEHTVRHVPDVEITRPSHTAYFAVTVHSLTTEPGALVLCTDVTGRVLAKELAVSPDALLWCIAQDGTAGFYNDRWRALIASDWRAAIHAADARRLAAAVEDAIARAQESELEVRLDVAGGTHRRCRVRIVPRAGYAICCVPDVQVAAASRAGERDDLGIQVRRARAEAERANRLRDVFLSAVSHELRAPLTTLLLWEKVLRENVDDEASRRQALEAIHLSAHAQARLVADLLDFARGTTGRVYLDIRLIDLDKIIREAFEAARPHADQKSVELVTTSPPFGEGVHADATRLRQIVDNLLSNAIKYTPPGGKVQVAIARRRDAVTIDVEDSGRGIDADALPRIFEPFMQADNPLTRRESGLGLGLAIARQLCELHRGTLSASSPGPGKGAKFTLSLPARGTSRAPQPPRATRQDQRLDGARLLVIDDDAQVRRALAVLLARLGASVDTAESAEDARAQIQANTPQALVCDIAMPGEDGLTLVRGLREAGCKIPTIALTAFATEIDAQRAADAGFDVHLTKPVSLERLVEALKELLDNRIT